MVPITFDPFQDLYVNTTYYQTMTGLPVASIYGKAKNQQSIFTTKTGPSPLKIDTIARLLVSYFQTPVVVDNLDRTTVLNGQTIKPINSI